MATVNLGRIKPVFRGAYSGSDAYVVDDIVTSGNQSYICIQAHGAGTQAVTQTAYWSILAAKGTDGTDVGTTITTQGDILYRDGSGLQRLAKGTATQILQMNSGATAPEWTAKPVGGVKQVVQGVFTGTASHQSNTPTFTQFTGLTATITPASTSNKILITSDVQVGGSNGYRHFWKMMFDVAGGGYNDLPFIGDSAGSRIRCIKSFQESNGGAMNMLSFAYLHSPSTTSALTYRWSACTESTSGYNFINRGYTDNDNNSYGRGASSIVLYEVTV